MGKVEDNLIAIVRESENADEVRDAAIKLGDMGCSKAVPDLIRLLQTTDNDFARNGAALGLSELKDQRALRPLVEQIELHPGYNGTLIYALEELDCRGIVESVLVDGETLVAQDKPEEKTVLVDKTYFSDGTVKSIQSYIVGDDGKRVLHGVTESWYEGGQKREEVHYADGKKAGTFKLWFESGQIRRQQVLVNGKRHGTSIEWYEDGQKREEAHHENGKKVGTWKAWFDNGKLQQTTGYKDGKRHGKATVWYEDGEMRDETDFDHGKKVGTWKSWFKDGQLRHSRAHKDDKLHGVVTSWYENGKKREEQHYREGNKFGTWKTWDVEGNLTSISRHGS